MYNTALASDKSSSLLARAVHRHFAARVAAACVLAACLWSGAAHADPLTSAGVHAATTPAATNLEELKKRYAGSYRYAGDARERDARMSAIERSAASFFVAVRGLVRSKLDDRTRIVPTCVFEFPEGKIRSTVPGHPIATSPENGAPAAYRIEDDAIALSQRFEGDRLVQTFTANEGGTRRNFCS
jgi:hypothetical protein